MNLILRELTINDELAFLKGYEDWKNHDLSWYTFVWKPGMEFNEHLRLLKEHQDNPPPIFVSSTMYYAFINQEIVGRLSFRHELNDKLKVRGGHIGYSVNPNQRRKGYATEILRQGLEYCKLKNLKKVLLTCEDSNIPSCKTIEKNGGILENKILDNAENKIIRRYWINLS